jgi:putative oxidoreductase
MNGSRGGDAWLDLIARILMGALFIIYGVLQTMRHDFYVGYMTKFSVPMPDILLPVAFIIEIGCGLLLVLGWKTRWAALALVVFTLIVTCFFHRYWEFDAAQGAIQMGNFYKNLAAVGGLIYVYLHGAGTLSLDARNSKALPTAG